MNPFVKKPIVITAVQWTGDNLRQVITFTVGPPETRTNHAGMKWQEYEDLVTRDGLKIFTLEGKMNASVGDWIIRGINGEFYPCKPDIFAKTYEPVRGLEQGIPPADLVPQAVRDDEAAISSSTDAVRAVASDMSILAAGLAPQRQAELGAGDAPISFGEQIWVAARQLESIAAYMERTHGLPPGPRTASSIAGGRALAASMNDAAFSFTEWCAALAKLEGGDA